MSKNPKNRWKELILTEKYSYLLNNLRNFNDIFRKDVTSDNIKIIKKKTGSHALSKKYNFGKIWGGGKTEPPSLLRIKTLI